jgi:hypothetical protein
LTSTLAGPQRDFRFVNPLRVAIPATKAERTPEYRSHLSLPRPSVLDTDLGAIRLSF